MLLTLLAHLHETTPWIDLTTPPTVTAVFGGIGLAFGFGAIHGLSPGHGKTLVSAYLIGTKGTASQAVLLGVMTTIAHTLTVFALGAIALFAAQFLDPEQFYPMMGAASGAIVCWVGINLLRRQQGDHCHHDHDHHHHHTPADLGGLVKLSIAGGLTPCPSALVMLMSAIALHQMTYGLLLVGSFSLGLAAVLITLGLIAVYARQWLEQLPQFAQRSRQLSVAGGIMVITLGLGLVWASSTTIL
ncbi:sulfite exporter TauE/SafE family protein [Spirulina sp. CCNP1310]|uniref:nickel/cobalt transporter n=1 Tax=Spirulina sp. CCNP1310 TaxID=3110249 RepID=UPI002B1FE9CC|nr:sulfite exporter TauE/SafE family protein [Spirulina sp. CCNP1310]MEA5421418.1 sulfite exporter TauE/SafE family protein [Spirulina sp. CCNP1310]